jgi:NhaA family Na+:H+ antiporter
MATDIAFALAVLTALGDKVPFGLRVFLTALAIVDDLGAVLVIAVFYTADISLPMLLLAAGVLALLVVANRFGVRRVSVYAVLGAVVWLAMLQSGVHATVAGVLVAMTVPARVPVDVAGFVRRTRSRIDEVEDVHAAGAPALGEGERQEAIEDIEVASEEAETPLQQIERRLGGFVAYGVVPVFALANAGVAFGGEAAPRLDRVAVGVFLGLVLGKQIGITLAAWLAVRLRLAALPTGANWSQLYGVAWLGGIGFTMSLFVTELAFEQAQLAASAKLGIFAASATAAAIGCGLLVALGRRAATLGGAGMGTVSGHHPVGADAMEHPVAPEPR